MSLLIVFLIFLTREIKTIKPQVKPSIQFPKKYYKAENQLFIQMMRNKQDAVRISQALSVSYVCDPVVFKLRNILMIKYYQFHEDFDKDEFIILLSKERDSEELTRKILLKSIIVMITVKSLLTLNRQ